VRLAPLTQADSATLLAWINDREQVLFNSAYKPVHERSHEAWFEAIQRRSDFQIFGIRLVSEDRLIGSCQLMHIDMLHRTAEMQIRLGEASERGSGLGPEALQALADFAFRDLNLHRLYAHIFAHNAASRRAFEKIGFRVEGTLRQAAHIDGAYVDVLILGLLRSEAHG
jgi:RimJ/RimL family protein N-acetyltransferase